MKPFTSPHSHRNRIKELAAQVKHSVLIARLRALMKYQWLINRSKDNVYIDDAGAKGLGIFASKPFDAGELVFIINGKIRYVYFADNDCYLYPDWFAIAENTWVDMEEPFVKINHSCEPNVGIDRDRLFVALRNIAPGDEILLDYSTTEDEMQWIMGPTECLCQSKDCRKQIGSIHSLSLTYIEKSYPYIPKYFYDLWKKNQQ